MNRLQLKQLIRESIKELMKEKQMLNEFLICYTTNGGIHIECECGCSYSGSDNGHGCSNSNPDFQAGRKCTCCSGHVMAPDGSYSADNFNTHLQPQGGQGGTFNNPTKNLPRGPRIKNR